MTVAIYFRPIRISNGVCFMGLNRDNRISSQGNTIVVEGAMSAKVNCVRFITYGRRLFQLVSCRTLICCLRDNYICFNCMSRTNVKVCLCKTNVKTSVNMSLIGNCMATIKSVGDTRVTNVIFVRCFGRIQTVSGNVRFVAMGLGVVTCVSRLRRGEQVNLNVSIFVVVSNNVIGRIRNAFVASRVSFVR